MRFAHLPHVVLAAALAASCSAACSATRAASTAPAAAATAPAAAPVASPAPRIIASSSAPAGAANAQPTAPRERFEYEVRADYFAGIAGDDAAFARAMKACDDALAANPDDAEALVWRGAGRLFEAGKAFRAGDAASGRALWTQALGEIDRAVALAPDDLGVRIPRGAVVIATSRYVKDDARARSLLERGVADYRTALARQEPHVGELSLHAREELFFGLADGEARLGHQPEARAFFERLLADCPDSSLVPYARAWLAGAPPRERPACTGCHGG